MRPITLALLGCLQAGLADGQPLRLPKKTQALLAYLGLRPGQAYARDRLAALLWGERGNKQARKSLRQAIHVLGRSLPGQVAPLVLKGETIALNAALVEVDVARFEQLVAEGSIASLEQAALLYRGELLEGLSIDEAGFDEWLTAERERLRELALQAVGNLLRQQTTAGHVERAVKTAVRLLALDPLQEDVHRTLMQLYARQGRRAAALKQYQRCAEALERELGTQPEEATRQLYLDIVKRQKAVIQPPNTKRAEVDNQPLPQPADVLLVGREHELNQLDDHLENALRGHGQVIAIAGEAGIGKSRLSAALASKARARGARVLIGHSHETEQGLALAPWLEALRSGNLRAEVATLDRDWRLFDLCTAFVRRLAAKQPLLIMLEDLHWADEMTLRLVTFLAHRIRDSGVLLVVTYRDDELLDATVLSQLIDELRREEYWTELVLFPLTRSATLALVGMLFGAELPRFAGLDEQIWRVSEGNPFIVVETLRALMMNPQSVAPNALPRPASVRRLMAARLRHLTNASRHLASVAAAIGREFDVTLLERASGLSHSEVAEGLEELVRYRLLEEVGEGFKFRQAPLREVIYDLLVQPRRTMLHAQVARALEVVRDDRRVRHHLQLVQHYAAARLWDKALYHSRQAAMDAASGLGNVLIPLAEQDGISGYLGSREPEEV